MLTRIATQRDNIEALRAKNDTSHVVCIILKHMFSASHSHAEHLIFTMTVFSTLAHLASRMQYGETLAIMRQTGQTPAAKNKECGFLLEHKR